jgi:hypothetical protein
MRKDHEQQTTKQFYSPVFLVFLSRNTFVYSMSLVNESRAQVMRVRAGLRCNQELGLKKKKRKKKLEGVSGCRRL